MKRINSPKIKRKKTGPKPGYIGRLHEAYMFALMGATNRDFAAFFQVDVSTIEYWRRHYPEFEDAIRRGGAEADALVAKRMYQRAIGYNFEEREYKYYTNPDTGAQTELLVKRVTRHVPASTTAGFKWLNIRQRDVWSLPELSMNMKHYVEGTVQHIHTEAGELDLSTLSEAAKEILFELNMQQLEQGKREN